MDWLIVGLGNPGQRYAQTRHNAGFLCLDAWCQAVDPTTTWKDESKHQALTIRLTLDGHKLLLAKPQTFMNRSGDAVRSLADYHGLTAERIVVVHDDLDLPLGRLRVKTGGGAGGHNGVSSIQQQLGTANFHRLRLGISDPEWFVGGQIQRPFADASGYVLGRLGADEQATMQTTYEAALEALNSLLNHGMEHTMQLFNGRS